MVANGTSLAGRVYRCRPKPATIAIMTALSFVAIGTALLVQSRAATPYYVDCTAGVDTNTGLAPSAAWKTTAKVSGITLRPGDAVLFKRGCTFSGTLTLASSGTQTSPITIGAYGTGDMPVITTSTTGRDVVSIRGSYIRVEDIYARAGSVSTDAACQNNPVGYIIGFGFTSGASYNVVTKSKATGGYAGVNIRSGAHHNSVINNVLADNIMMHPLTPTSVNGNDDAGAFGVVIAGDDNAVGYNTITGHYACSYDYDGDGAAVEIYGGQRNHIHHNVASQNEAFSELGNSRTADTVYSFNRVTSDIRTSSFLITRGASASFGPVATTKLYHNSVYLTGASSSGVVCHGGCGPGILTMKNNILWANWKSLYADAPFDESNNIYWKTGGSPLVQATISPTSKKSDPQFLGLTDLHIASQSPAVNAGVTVTGMTKDIDGQTVPAAGAADIGADEFGMVTMPGDANNDSRVNALDLSIVLTKDGQYFLPADFNGDGVVGAADMAILLGNWTW